MNQAKNVVSNMRSEMPTVLLVFNISVEELTSEALQNMNKKGRRQTD